MTLDAAKIRDTEQEKAIADVANELRSLTLTALSVAAYIGLTIIAIRDCDLVSGEGTTHLPLVDATVSLTSAMIALPLALVLFFIYVYENLARLRVRAAAPIDVWPLSECGKRLLGHGLGLSVLTQILVWGAWPLVSGILVWRVAPLSGGHLIVQALFFATAFIVSVRYWLVTTRAWPGPRATALGLVALALSVLIVDAAPPLRRTIQRHALKDFVGAHLVGFRLDHLDVSNANFTSAELSGVDFQGVKLEAASFAKANLERASFACDKSRLDLSRVDFTDAKAARISFVACRLSKLAGSDLSGANLWNAQLSDAHAEDAQLTRANLTGVRALESRAIFDGISATGATFYGAVLPRASFAFASLDAANFTAADLDHASFVNAKLQKARFAGANLCGADLSAADLTGADFAGACLRGAKYDGQSIFPAELAHESKLRRLGMVRSDGRDEQMAQVAEVACPKAPSSSCAATL